MKRLILASLLFATPAMAKSVALSNKTGAQLFSGTYTSLSDVGIIDPDIVTNCKSVLQWTQPNSCNVAVGLGSGTEFRGKNWSGAGNLLVGNNTHGPSRDAVGFVNIGNLVCGWRGDTPKQFQPTSCPETK